VALDAGDRARLQRIESRLAQDDPRLVARFRSWRPTEGPSSMAPGWSAAPLWALLVFLAAFGAWMADPSLGAVVVVVGVLGRLWVRAARRAHTTPTRTRR
jgi:hypothetical protein